MRALALLCASCLVGCAGLGLPSPNHGAQVVSLYVTYQSHDEDRPWSRHAPRNREAFAAVIPGPGLLTLAQMVEDETLIQAEKGGDGRRWAARVEHVDPDINLAVVTVDDPAFYEGLHPVRFAAGLPTDGSVRSLRWQDGQLESSTSRVVRVVVNRSRTGNVEHAFLEVQTDVSAGGWSEPAFRGRELTGLTSSQEDDQRALLIPPELLSAYVERVGSGRHRGFASLGLSWQNNRDPVLARWLGQGGEPRGVVVRSISGGGSACGVFEPRDVLLELDGHAIDGVGNYEHPRYGRIPFAHIAVDDHAPGDVVKARVLRAGEELEFDLELRAYPSNERLVPWYRAEPAPPYRVAGGLVFRELDGSYLRSWGEEWLTTAPAELVSRFFLESHAQSAERRRLIVLASVLPDAYNLGYHQTRGVVVERVNGQPIDSIADLDAAFGAPDGGFHVVELAPTGGRRRVVLDAAEFESASELIRDAYRIPAASRLPTLPLLPIPDDCTG